MNSGWKYYNHALLPTCAPHETPNIDNLDLKDTWYVNGNRPLLARWTTSFDCGYETNWWYVIKDSPFYISELPSKRRKNIKSALKKCTVSRIDPVSNINSLYEVYIAAFRRYKEADNQISYKEFVDKCISDKSMGIEYWAGFSQDSNQLIGYMTIAVHSNYVESCVAKYHPDYMKLRVSDALHYSVLEEYLNRQGKRYITSGERSINHITNSQEYKIQSFGFRKAYCYLHIRYRPIFGIIVNCLFPFRNLLMKMDNCSIIHSANAILDLEELARESKKCREKSY